MRATVLVRPKPGILDPQGEAVLGSLKQLGFAVDDARVGRVVDLELQNGDREQARADLERMCEQLLANPLIESYEIELVEEERPRPSQHRESPSSPSRARTTNRTRRTLSPDWERGQPQTRKPTVGFSTSARS